MQYQHLTVITCTVVSTEHFTSVTMPAIIYQDVLLSKEVLLRQVTVNILIGSHLCNGSSKLLMYVLIMSFYYEPL